MVRNDDNNGEVNDGLNGEVSAGFNLNYREFDKMTDFADVPMDSVEGDGADWDPSYNQYFPPIGFDEFLGINPSYFSNEYANKAPSRNHNTQVSIESEQKEQVDCVVARDGVNTSGQNVISLETSASQTRSPISVLETSSACSAGRSLPTRFVTWNSVRARSKRGPPSNSNLWFMNTPIAAAASVAKKSPNSINGKKRPRTTELSIAPKGLNGSLQQATKILPEDVNHEEKKVTSKQQYAGAKRCTHCHVTKTPQWREGPLGKNTLCNACGARYRSGRLYPEYRPAASPTFTPSLHSNSHRKVIEMRGKATEETVLVENPMSSLSESVPMSSHLFDDSVEMLAHLVESSLSFL